jgi:phospholipid/cholesterol/gamma-HCH transport system ATP-binding protein
VSLRVPEGQVTVILGGSGSGKSTLLRHLIGLQRPTAGEILVKGRDIARLPDEELVEIRKRMGVLFQSGALFNSMTVRENIEVPLKVHTRLSEETIRIMSMIKLHLVGLSDFGRFMPSQLSGGMRKRAGLARALSMDPEILFVDEPSSGLDPITAAGLDRLILELRAALGMTIIVVTHELESAFLIADQLVVLEQGRLMAVGSPDEIRSSRDSHVVQFLNREADMNPVDEQGYFNRLIKT